VIPQLSLVSVLVLALPTRAAEPASPKPKEATKARDSEKPTDVPTPVTVPDAIVEMPPTVPSLTFDEAIRRTIARNPTVGVALAEVQRADALVLESRSGWYPTVAATGTYTRLDHNRPKSGPAVLKENEEYGSLVVTVPLVAPQGWTAESHAKDNRRIAESSAADVRRLVAQAAGNAYLAVIAQRLQLNSNDTAIANAKAHATYAHTRLLGGIGRSIDDVRAQQDLATVLVTRQRVLTGLSRAREALGVLVGSAEPLDADASLDLGILPSLPAALEEVGTRRPDVQAGHERITAAERLRKDVWAYYAPYLAAVGQPFLQDGQTVLPTFGWQAGLLLTLPIYDGGQRGGVARERDAGLAEARLDLEGTLRQAHSEVRVAFDSMLHADQALTSAREGAALAKRAYDLAVLAYKAGASSNIEVLDAARQARDADSEAFAAGDIARRARLDLLVASGRFP
jgi:outer membrane protein TolC